METEAEIAAIPVAFVRDDDAGMHCVDDRCSALTGSVGKETSCSIYAVRPHVCRACVPGDGECMIARRAFGLPALTPAP
jgi:uncharacterized protein